MKENIHRESNNFVHKTIFARIKNTVRKISFPGNIQHMNRFAG